MTNIKSQKYEKTLLLAGALAPAPALMAYTPASARAVAPASALAAYTPKSASARAVAAALAPPLAG